MDTSLTRKSKALQIRLVTLRQEKNTCQQQVVKTQQALDSVQKEQSLNESSREELTHYYRNQQESGAAMDIYKLQLLQSNLSDLQEKAQSLDHQASEVSGELSVHQKKLSRIFSQETQLTDLHADTRRNMQRLQQNAVQITHGELVASRIGGRS